MHHVLYLLILVVILGAGAALADLPGLEAYPTPATGAALDSTNGWRRTAQGWEHISAWRFAAPQTPWVVANVNPVTLALVQLTVAVGILIHQQSVSSRRPRAALSPKTAS